MPTIVIGIFAAQVVDKLVDRKVFWRCGRIEVDEAFADDPNLLEDLSGCFVAVAQFRKFSASRFLTVATSMRPIVGCIALGLGALLDIIFQDKAQSQYYIRGAKRLSVSVRKYAVIASLAAWPTDAAMVHLMRDDRLARWVDSMDDDMKQELYYLSNLSDASWSLFDDVVGADPSPRVLRTEVLTAASISAAFVYRRAFRSAKSLPWTLTRGCIAENLRALAAGDMPDETISAKIWQLMRLGYNVKELTEALGLLAEARWSTKVVEQQHGSAAAMHKAHPSYIAESLSRRAFLHMVTALLPSPSESWHIGDLSYAVGVEPKWDYWMETVKPVMRQVPYMITVGNHDYSYLTGSERDPSGAAAYPFQDQPHRGVLWRRQHGRVRSSDREPLPYAGHRQSHLLAFLQGWFGPLHHPLLGT